MPRITVKAHGVKLTAKSLEDFGADIPRVSKGRIYGRMMAAKKRISTYPPPWRGSLPKNWYKSEAQRRKVMVLLREGKIPYQRTGAYMDAWKLEALPSDMGYRLTTSGKADAYAQYVGGNAYGKNQAKIHQGRWGVAREIVDDELGKLPREIDQALTVAGKRRGL